MEVPEQSGEQGLASEQRAATQGLGREARWRRVRSLRLRNWFFSFFWPFLLLALFCACEAGVYFLVQLFPGLNPHEAAVSAAVLQILLWLVFIAAIVYLSYSPRGGVWIRHWGGRGPWSLAGAPAQLAAIHSRYCAARNVGTAVIFLGFTALEVFYALRDWSTPLPSERPSAFLIIGFLFTMAYLVILSVDLACFRERLVLGIGVVAFGLRLFVHIAPSLALPYSRAIRDVQSFLWFSAALTSLALLKSALRAPPPGVRGLH